MEFAYRNLATDELHGTRLEELLLGIEADIVIADGGEVVFSEPGFPVTELACDLMRWVASGDPEPCADFAWDSMSYAELGAIRICRHEGEWRLGSAYDPGTWSTPRPWSRLQPAIRDYVTRVRADVEALGIDPSFIPPPETSRHVHEAGRRGGNGDVVGR